MTNQGAFTAIVKIDPAQLEPLRKLLTRDIGDHVDTTQCPIPFHGMTSVHFMRWVIDEGTDSFGQPIQPSLILEANFDLPDDHAAPESRFLNELVQIGGQTVRDIYSKCLGFGPNTDLPSFLRSHSYRYDAFYVGTRGRTVQDIHRERDLRDAIQHCLREPAVTASNDPIQIREQIQARIFAMPEFEWAKESRSRFQWWLVRWRGPLAILFSMVVAWVLSVVLLDLPWWGFPAAVLVFLVLVVLYLLAWRRMIVAYEKRDQSDDVSNPIQRVQELTEREDQLVQNQLTHVVSIKPQWFRRRTLRTVLWAIDVLGRFVYTRGALGGIPSIHFARWVVFDDNRRLLFMSNFDGSWENYLGDFIDKAAPGLTAVWSNTMGCPRSEGLIGAGARDEQRFKSWTREHQIFTQVWYSAYEDLSVENINNNSKIRDGLVGRLSRRATEEWLSLL